MHTEIILLDPTLATNYIDGDSRYSGRGGNVGDMCTNIPNGEGSRRGALGVGNLS